MKEQRGAKHCADVQGIFAGEEFAEPVEDRPRDDTRTPLIEHVKDPQQIAELFQLYLKLPRKQGSRR